MNISTRAFPGSARKPKIPVFAKEYAQHKSESGMVDRHHIIRLLHGFIYLIAIIDWFSRYVLSREVSISLETEFCLSAQWWRKSEERVWVFLSKPTKGSFRVEADGELALAALRRVTRKL